MIVSRRREGLVLIRQVDHQEQCGAMARRWGNRDFARPEPYAPLELAAAVHDEGWRGWEERPAVEGGEPVDFPDIDRRTHVALYRAGIAHALGRDPRAGLLVAMHGRGLYEGRGGLDAGPVSPRSERPPGVREFLDEQDALVERLHRRLGGGPELGAWAWAAYRLLQTWDALSLYLTWRSLPAGREGSLPQVPRGVGDPGITIRLRPAGPEACTLDPWPFAVPELALPVASRTIEDRAYRSDADLQGALDRAPWEERVLVLRP